MKVKVKKNSSGKNETKKLLASGVVPVRAVTLAVKSFPLEISTALSFYAEELRVVANES